MLDLIMLAVFAGSAALLWLLLEWCAHQVDAEQ